MQQKQNLYTRDTMAVGMALEMAKDDLLDALKCLLEAQGALQNVVNRLHHVGAILPDETSEAI
ncbi:MULTISPECIES: hypothetical protein [Streptomyces]|uniref:hypothetical protein n=1 Tax=Streptomyces TaxID=1883 RepID=UPI0036A22CC4